MNNFHFYDEIGRGKHSVVYKGRRKKTLQYVAIKSVEKKHRPKVLNEVRVMHALKYPNILQFYNWYETTNHLWLIVEYCTGGDLFHLLCQDTKLPEESIESFGLDIMAGLQYCHSNGVLYCDLKPSNVLIDEFGCLKLCDFGLAQRVEDLQGQSKKNLRRGTPCYMAPELFQEGGKPSYASEFWALGVLMYELAAGRPPFVSTSFQDLMQQILNNKTPKLPRASPAFQNLLEWLLEKNPADRPTWTELRDHPFWSKTLKPLPIPDIPGMPIRAPSRAASAEDRAPSQQAPSLAAAAPRKVESQPQAVADEKVKVGGASSRGKPVDVMRLSRIAKQNLEKESDEYRRPSGSGADGQEQDVELKSHDMELNFNDGGDEEDEDGGPSNEDDGQGNEPDGDQGEEGWAYEVEEDMQDLAIDDKDPASRPKTAPLHLQKLKKGENGIKKTAPKTAGGAARPVSAFPANPTERSDVSEDCAHDAKQLIHAQMMHNLGDSGTFMPVDKVPMRELLYHPSDTMVKPIIGNNKIEKLADPVFDPRPPFNNMNQRDIFQLPESELEIFLTQLYKSIAGQTVLAEKMNTLAYFETICQDTQAANLLVNSSLMTLFVKMLRPSLKAASLKVRLLSVMGHLIRHATYIDEQLCTSGMIATLTDHLREKNEKVKRRAMATLGELMFYIATQQEDPEYQGKQDGWNISSATINCVTRVLRAGEDEIVQHYAAKTIENISSHSAEYGKKFGTTEVAFALLNMYHASRNESLRTTAISCLARIGRHAPGLVLKVVENVGMKATLTGMNEGNARMQQSWLTLFNLAIIDGTSRMSNALKEDMGIVPTFLKLLEHSIIAVRGKALLAVSFLLKMNSKWLSLFVDNKVVPLLERMARDKEVYIRQCVEILVETVVGMVPNMLSQITTEMDKMSGRKAPPPSNVKALRSHLTSFPVVLHLFTYPLFRPRITTKELIQDLSKYLLNVDVLQIAGIGGDFKRDLFNLVEALSAYSTVLLVQHEIVLGDLLPALLSHLGSDSGDTRFNALKIFSDIIMLLLSQPGIYDLSASEEPSTRRTNELVVKQLLPKYKSILEDEGPIPVYGLKLLSGIVEKNPGFVSIVQRMNLVPSLLGFLEDGHPNNNVYNLKVIQAICESNEVDWESLYDNRIVGRVVTMLGSAHQQGTDNFFEPLMDTVYCLLYRTFTIVRKANQSPRDPSQKAVVQQALADNEEFLSLVDLLVEFASYGDDGICEKAANCTYLCAQLYDRPECHEKLLQTKNLSNFAQALDMGHETVQKRLLKTLQWVTSADSHYKTKMHGDNVLMDVLKRIAVSGQNEQLQSLAKGLYAK